nr:fibronectin type III domain-containing protein [Actinopolymorpha pittospori]
MYDRPGDDDSNGGTLSFSDGSTVEVRDLPRNGGARTLTFPMKTFDRVRFQVAGGTGLNPGLSEFEVYAVPSAPEAPTDVSVVRDGDEATVSWKPPTFDGGAPLTGYVVTARRDGVPEKTVEVDENTTEAVLDGLSAAQSYDFTVAARNLIGTGPGMGEPVLATGLAITGPNQVVRPYGSARFEVAFTPDDTTLKKARWSVTESDGSPTDKATIDDAGVLRVNHRDGNVVVTATAADAGGVSTNATVTIALDPSLYRSNASRWPGASATASSQFNNDFRAAKVHDGFGAAAGEWASGGEQNPWIRLEWTTPVQADTITLYDRPGVDDATGGTLSFSDGSSVPVDGIPADGGAKTVSLGQKRFTWVRFQVVGGSGPNVGLAEFEVAATPSPPQAPTDVAAAPLEDGVVVSWSPPAFDGGAPLTGYVVTPYRQGVALDPVNVEAGLSSATVTGLSAGQAYEFGVAARNIVGTGPESARTEPVVPT